MVRVDGVGTVPGDRGGRVETRMSVATSLVPVGEGTLGWLGWRRGLVGVEPVPPPRWTAPPPDPARIEAQIRQESAELRRAHDTAAHNAAYYAPVVRTGLLAIGFAVLATAFLVGSFLSSGLDIATLADSQGEPAQPTGALTAASLVVLFGPWFAAVALHRRRRLSRRAGWFLTGVGLWFLALLLSCFTLGLSFVLMPLVIGLIGLFTRPVVYHVDHGTTGRAPANPLRSWREARQEAAQARVALGGVDARVREEIERQHRAYAEQSQAHQHAIAAHIPYAVADLPEVRDLIVVGGTPVERGDLLHHLGAHAAVTGDGIWVLDLEGRGGAGRLLAEATTRQRQVGVLSTGDEHGLVRLLDALDGQAARRSSALVDVLAYGLAQDSEARVVGRARESADTLRRIEQHLRGLPGGVTLARLHAAVDALLAGGQAGLGSVVRDDFGLAGPAAAAADPAGLPAELVERVRGSFSQQDRQHFYPVWTDLRIKLETLLPLPSDGLPPGDPARQWSIGRDCNFITTPAGLGRADRELRGNLLVAHHLQLLAGAGRRPAAIAVTGAGQVPSQLLEDLSTAAGDAGVLLVLMFNELTPVVEQLALGRRHVAVFGGHGAQAAERLAELFGRGWQARLQSYQQTWSQAEARSRAETSGRSWSHTEGRSRSSSRSSSYSSATGDGGSTSSSSHGHTSTTGDSESWQDGGSSSISTTRSDTETRGGGATTGVEYERRITGSQIGTLPPYTMLLKHGDDVRVVDVKADLPLPAQLTGVAVIPA